MGRAAAKDLINIQEHLVLFWVEIHIYTYNNKSKKEESFLTFLSIGPSAHPITLHSPSSLSHSCHPHVSSPNPPRDHV
jgi:hypothetical protein